MASAFHRSIGRLAVAVLLSATAVTLAAGCGGDEQQDPVLPGVQGADPGAPQFGDNAARFAGTSPTDVAGAAVLAVYPPDEDEQPAGWVLFSDRDWRAAANGAQFAGDPVNGALLPIKPDYLPPAAVDLFERVEPTAFPNSDDLRALVIGRIGPEVVTAIEEANIDLAQINQPTPAATSKELVPFRGGWAEAYSDSIMIVSEADSARGYALPAMAWSAYSGDTLAWVDGARIPPVTEEIVAGREALRIVKPTIYLIGPESVIPASVADELSEYGEVKRVSGATPAATAVALARYRDEGTGFGWGLEEGPANVLLANLKHPGDAVAALNLAGAGPQAPLLLNDGPRRLSPVVVNYLEQLRNRDGNQGFVFGDQERLSSRLFEEFDELLGPGRPPRDGGGKGEGDGDGDEGEEASDGN